MTQRQPSADLDPFRDSSAQEEVPDKLVLGRHASLTLGTDSLVVLDETLAQQQGTSWWSRCCGLLPSNRAQPTRAIPFYNILNAAVNDFDITIHYAQQVSSSMLKSVRVAYPLEKALHTEAGAWVERLLDRSYGASQRKKRIKILINPFGGSGRAQRYYEREIEPIFSAAACELDVERTQYAGHAAELAEKIDVDQYDVLASCSGDGLPHEVFNGLGRRPDARRALKGLAVVQLPCGSGNAMSLNLNGTNSPSIAALAVVKGLETPMDLVSVTQGDTRTLSFLSQALGIIAEADIGTEHLRWMGEARFTYGILVLLLAKAAYPCDIAIQSVMDDKGVIRERHRQATTPSNIIKAFPEEDSSAASEITDESEGLPSLRFGTVQDDLPTGWQLEPFETVGNFYAGNMAMMAADTTFFAAALPSDGCIDVVSISAEISRWKAVQLLLAVANGTLFDLPHVHYWKAEGFRVVPRPRQSKSRRRSLNESREGMIAIDGEKFPFKPFQVEVHRGLGTVLSKSGKIYESPPMK
ncbi:MAG: sphinganine kinase lcb4 [Chrysothrix sp. TS-e1954]|nr:MAG: sphinganine kinase lcb4 [Chrysothrix sp. TS-e1954]